MVHSVGSAHNVALLGLAEDLAQVHAWDDSGLNGIRQHLARAHRRQLIHIPCTSLTLTKAIKTNSMMISVWSMRTQVSIKQSKSMMSSITGSIMIVVGRMLMMLLGIISTIMLVGILIKAMTK